MNFENGHEPRWGRAAVVGSLVGFVVVGGLYGLTTLAGAGGVVEALGVGLWAGCVGGVGYGGMIGASECIQRAEADRRRALADSRLVVPPLQSQTELAIERRVAV